MTGKFKTILAATAMLFAAHAQSSAQEAGAWVPPAAYTDAETGESYDIVVGKADAPVTIYEYASLTCPHCKAYQDVAAAEVQKQWIDSGKAKLVYRHFPLDQAALAAALTVQCMPSEKRYDTVKLFFKTVERWQTNTETLVTVLEEAYGGDLSFIQRGDEERAEAGPEAPTTNKARLIACLNRKGFPERSLQSMVEAANNGVNSTPYFIINGEHVRGAQSAEKIGEVIQRKLNNE